MNNIYLDNAATTPVDERVKEAMLPVLENDFGNPSSVHRKGREIKVLLEEARETIASYIGAKPSEIYFTSGGTEANNMAIKGIAFANLGKKNHIISSVTEHSAVIDTLDYLRDRFGFRITMLDADRYGNIDLNKVKDSISDDTLLISVMHSNNELGNINDVKAVSEIAKNKEIYVHTDSVQSIGKIKFDVNDAGCDLCTISSHKIYAPKGTGVLYVKRGTVMDKLIHGGKQERDRRGGTENIPGITALRKAIMILKEEMDDDIKHYSALKSHLISQIENNFHERVIINSLNNESSLPNIVNITIDPQFTKIDADTLLIKLDTRGVMVSSGSACSSGSVKPSRVLKAIGHDDEAARSSLRISFGRKNKTEDVDYFVNVLKDIISS